MELVGPADLVLGDVPLPAPDVRDRLRLRELLAGLAQGLLVALAAGDVRAGAEPPHDLAVGVGAGVWRA